MRQSTQDKGLTMNEKRRFKRFPCRLKARFDYYNIDDPEQTGIEGIRPEKGKGHIMDISRGGMFIATNSNLGINRPVKVYFKTSQTVYEQTGMIVRTGLMQNNPSEILLKFQDLEVSEKAYIAVQFDQNLDELDSLDIR